MQRSIDIGVFLLFVAITAFSQAGVITGELSKKAEALRAEVLALEETGRLRSLKGETNWDDMMADGAFMISPDGMTLTYRKGQTMPSFSLKRFDITELVARVYGDSVTVTGLAEIEVFGPEKKLVSFQVRYINVWARIEGAWKIIVSGRMNVKGSVKTN